MVDAGGAIIEVVVGVDVGVEVEVGKGEGRGRGRGRGRDSGARLSRRDCGLRGEVCQGERASPSDSDFARLVVWVRLLLSWEPEEGAVTAEAARGLRTVVKISLVRSIVR